MHLRCQIHSDEPLHQLCLSKECQKRGLICLLCKLEHHQDHDPLIPLRPFIDSFLINKTFSSNFVSYTVQIDQHFILIDQSLLKLKRKCLNFDIIQQASLNYWKQTKEQITKYNDIVKDLSRIISSSSDNIHKELNQWIEKHHNLYPIQQEEETENKNNYIALLKNIIQTLQNIKNSIQDLDSKSTFDDRALLELFQKEQKYSSFKLRFSEDLMGTCMSILSPTKASMTKSGSQRMLLLEPSLNKNRSIKKWKVKIENMASWVGVGISHLDSVKGVNFDFSYTSANHGNYLVSSNGYSWNGYKMEFNSKFETFTFITGDIIEIIYNPVSNQITFIKQNHQKTFTYDVDPNQKPLHASINLTGIGDTVEILP